MLRPLDQQMASFYYFQRLFLVNPTNASLTISQLFQPISSLKMVSINPQKELQNVLPKGNPFHLMPSYNHQYDRL